MVVKKSDPELVLNGRAALCAGKDDLSSEEEEHNLGGNGENGGSHRFNHPNNFKYILESGGIPDAAMIHAARKSRQKARELGKKLTLINRIIIQMLINSPRLSRRLHATRGQ